MNKTYFILFAFVLLALGSSCNKEDIPPIEPSDYFEVASGTASSLDIKINVLADDTAIVGYNELMVELLDANTNEPITDASITVTPIMHMNSGMTHSAPVEPNTQISEDMYPCQVVFIMPSGEMGYWELRIRVQTQAGQEEEVNLKVNKVRLMEETQMKSMMGSDSQMLFVSLVQPKGPEVGINDFEVCVHQRLTMMEFPAVEDLNIEIEPEMPTMGHGSPNNVNPGHQQMGHYLGKVNFTMDGFWRVHVRLKDGDVMVAETYFDMTF